MGRQLNFKRNKRLIVRDVVMYGGCKDGAKLYLQQLGICYGSALKLGIDIGFLLADNNPKVIKILKEKYKNG